MRRFGFSLAAALAAFAGHAEPYEDPLLRLEIPPGFQGPVSGSQDASTEIVAFRWPYPAGDASTLLQITKYHFGLMLAEMPEEERGRAAQYYLQQFLGGIARRRSAFTSSEPVRVDLDGQPGAKVSWEGLAQGRRLTGVMYCVIVGTTVVSFHTQDFDPVPLALRDAIVRSLESVVWRNSSRP